MDKITEGANMKTKTTHTPGPWFIQISGGKYEYVRSKHSGDLQVVVEGQEGTEEGYETRHANARLIASSPELLSALKSADSNFDIYTAQIAQGENLPRLQMEPCLEQAWLEIRAAIAKAEGL